MGNQTVMSANTPPFTEKKTIDYDSHDFLIGLAEMQGWRNSMEDASLIHIAKIHKAKNKINKIPEGDSSFEDDAIKENNEFDKENDLFSSSSSEDISSNPSESSSMIPPLIPSSISPISSSSPLGMDLSLMS